MSTVGPPGDLTVRVNGEAVRLWSWARWKDAVTAWNSAAGNALSKNEGLILDRNGQPVDPDGAVVDGGDIRFVSALSSKEIST